MPVQFAVNAEMHGAVGGPMLAAAISFVVETLALLVACRWHAKERRPLRIRRGRRVRRGPGASSGRSTGQLR